MATANPTVSIVIRTKDRPVLAERALASVAAQTYRPIEVVVVNDGGVPLDEERLRRVAGDLALRYLTLTTSTGRAHAANAGLAAAFGAWVGFLDDDDELLPHHVVTLVTQAVLTGARVVYSDCEMVARELGPTGEIVAEESGGRFFLSRDFSPEVLRFENFIPLICVLFSRVSLDGVGGLDETLELFEDWDFYLRIAARHPFHHVPEITARYVQWSTTSQIAFTGRHDGRAAYLKVLAKHGNRLGPREILAYYLAKQADAKSAAERQRSLEREVAGIAARLDELMAEKAALEARNRALAVRVAEHEALIAGITESTAWKLLHAYRTGLKASVAPAGSLRRRAYDALLGAGRSRLPDAPAPSAKRASQPARPPAPAPLPAPSEPAAVTIRETFTAPARAEAEAVPLMAVASVVIPTLDAGPEFRAVLQRLRGQRGLAEVEIVAVDSGSSDGTLATCREFGVTVVPYSGAAFNHGLARTQGAAATRGEYLLFLSQDAYPVGDGALARMAHFLAADPSVAAASGREVPRSDADLFSCWQQWTFNEKILAYTADTATGLGPGGLAVLAPAERRKVAQLNNVFCCVRRAVFDEVGLRPLPFAEDLDFGLRVLEAGHRLAFMPTVGVVHSHRRPAPYHLKRLFVDWLAQVDLLGFEPQDWTRVGIDSAAALVGGLSAFCRRLGPALAKLDPSGAPAAVEQRLHDALFAGGEPLPGATTSLDGALAALASDLCGAGALPPEPSEGRMFRDRYRHLMHELFEFAAAYGDLSSPVVDLHGSLLSLYGHLAGWCLADYVRSAERAGRDAAGAAAVTRMLAGGV